MSDTQHRVYVFHSLTDEERHVLDAAGVDRCHMRSVRECPLVIETCGSGNAVVSYGYVTSIPVERIRPLIEHRSPTISETVPTPPAGILTRLRTWLTTHIFPGGAR